MLTQFDHRRYLIPFRSQLLPHIFTDTLVIGGGVAGAQAAIESAAHGDVLVLMKQEDGGSNTTYAQGGIAAARLPDDSADAHVDDTLAAGAGLCDEDAVRVLADGAREAIDDLISWGMQFDCNEDGSLAFAREAAHSHPRILHAGGAATGRELVRCLVDRARSLDSIRIFRDCFALDLLTIDDAPLEERRVLGAITHHRRYGLQIIWARSTILASGGAGQVYRETTNPRVASGDGIAMAYRAGADVMDLEFMQFHPTTLYVAGAARLLISEAVRGEGAHLVDREGRRFMPEYDERAELAPRDVVARSIVRHLARTQEEAVFLDARHLEPGAFNRRFPNLASELATFELDPERDLIPVHPAAHYTIGGVTTDHDGRTSLPGLFACGEVACSGLHGANRLASNSLLEGLVFGKRAARAAVESAAASAGPMKIISHIPATDHAELDLVDVRSSLRSTMWRNVGIERSGNRLDDVQTMFDFWARYTMDMVFDDPIGWELQNLLLVGALMTQSATWRTESRGAHQRRDHPVPNDSFRSRAMESESRGAARRATASRGPSMTGPQRRISLLLATTTLVGAVLSACAPYRIEYHRKRPAYYDRYADGPLLDRVELDDGTVVVYGEEEKNTFQASAESTQFKIRDVDDDGNVTLRALLPEHVIANALSCLRNGEYEIMWDQLIAEQTKMAYQAAEVDYKAFERFCRENRVEMARTLNRMLLGFVHHEVAVERRPDGVTECRFWPHVGAHFKFRTVEITQEGFGMKLVMIR